jgi:hypothetical protein
VDPVTSTFGWVIVEDLDGTVSELVQECEAKAKPLMDYRVKLVASAPPKEVKMSQNCLFRA